MAFSIKKFIPRFWTKKCESMEGIEKVLTDLETFLSKCLPRILNEAENGNFNSAILLNQLLDGFREIGASHELVKIKQIYKKELKSIKRIADRNIIPASEQFQTIIDVDTIRSLVRFRVEDIQNNSIKTIGSLRPLIIENMILGTTPNLSLLSGTFSDSLIDDTKMELNTALMAFSRTVSLVQAESVGFEQFYYMGPDDKITRPFCGQVLHGKTPPIYTIAEIEALDNGQGLSPAIYGGGYNCRHRWRAVSRKFSQKG